MLVGSLGTDTPSSVSPCLPPPPRRRDEEAGSVPPTTTRSGTSSRGSRGGCSWRPPGGPSSWRMASRSSSTAPRATPSTPGASPPVANDGVHPTSSGGGGHPDSQIAGYPPPPRPPGSRDGEGGGLIPLTDPRGPMELFLGDLFLILNYKLRAMPRRRFQPRSRSFSPVERAFFPGRGWVRRICGWSLGGVLMQVMSVMGDGSSW